MKTRSTAGLAFGVSLALAGSLAVVPAVSAEPTEPAEPQTCKNPGVEIVSGTVDWGVKTSWRSYITGNIAKGQWTIGGAVKEGPQAKNAKDFQFLFEVDPAKSNIKVDKDGNVTEAKIQTKDSSIEFEGHKGALYSKMQSPYFEIQGNTVRPGVTYVAYYVEGKGMTEYTPADRIEANKVTGTDTFGQGAVEAVTEGDIIHLETQGMKYKQKPGTNYDPETKKQTVEGIDRLFLGTYNENYQPELDDASIALKTRQVCNDAATPSEKPSKPSESSKPSQPSKPGKDPNGSSQGSFGPMAWIIPLVSALLALGGGFAWLAQNFNILGKLGIKF